jgi:hypothetical protein
LNDSLTEAAVDLSGSSSRTAFTPPFIVRFALAKLYSSFFYTFLYFLDPPAHEWQ